MVFTDDEGVAHECTLTQKWPIKTPRPVNKRLPISMPLVTGQRVIDTLFPIAKVEQLQSQEDSVLVRQ